MYSYRFSLRDTAGLIAGLLVFLLTSPSDAGDVAAKTPMVARDKLPDHRFVLRLSGSLLNSLMKGNDIELISDVREEILGTSISGKARLIGKPGIKLVESDHNAAFHITLDGVVSARTVGYNGPAIIYSRSETKFSASRQVIFEPGKGFYALPTQVSARTETFVDGIGSTRRGLIGRIVRRRAAEIERVQHATSTEIARQKAERRIDVAFDRHTQEQIASLNKAASSQLLAAATFEATSRGEPQYACCTTSHYLQFAPGLGHSDITINLPAIDVGNRSEDSIEIWMHESLVHNWLAAGVDLLTRRVGFGNLISAVCGTPQCHENTDNERVPMGPILGNRRVRMHQVGDWRVVQIDLSWVPPTIEEIGSGKIAARKGQPIIGSNENSQSVAKQVLSPPTASSHRIWTSGAYRADARFLNLDGDTVRLLRTNGRKTSIPLGKLSPPDREWIRRHVADERSLAAGSER